MKHSPKRPNSRSTRPQLENLENRLVMAVAFPWAQPIAATAPAAALSKTGGVGFAPDGSMYVVGSGRDTLTFGAQAGATSLTSPASGQESAYLAKYSATGSLIFARPLPDAGLGGFASASALTVDGNGNLYVGAKTTGGRAAVLKLNGEGQSIWANVIDSTSAVNSVNDIAIDTAGSVVAAGTFKGTNVDFDPTAAQRLLTSKSASGEAFVAKYTGQGALVFAIATEGTSSAGVVGNGVATDSQNQIYLVGGFNGTVDFDPSPIPGNLDTSTGLRRGELKTPSGLDPFILRLSTDGAIIWGRSFQGQNDAGAPARFSEASDVTVEGSSIYVSGTLVGVATVNFETNPFTGQPDTTKPVTVTGGAAGSSFLVKYDVNSAYRWTRIAGGGASRGEHVVTDGKGNLTVAGTYQTNMVFGAGLTAITLNATGKDVFVARYAADGLALEANGVLSGNGAGSEFAEGSISVTGLAVHASSGDLGLTGGYSGSSAAPTGSNPPSARFGSIVLPELGRQGGLAVGEAGNAFVSRIAPAVFSGGGGGGGGGDGTPAAIGPVVKNVRIATVRIRRRGPKQKVIQVDYEGTFQSLAVQNRGNYVFRTAGRDRRFNTRDDRTIAFRSLSYDSNARTVTLTTRGKLATNQPLRLTITGLLGGVPSVTFLGRPARA